MSSLSRLPRFALFLFITLPAVLSTVGCRSVEESPKKGPPNVIYILADDLGYGELGCYGQTKIRTPHLDRLASEGMRFTRHYCGAPVCAPSRCVLLTGKHLGHATIRDNKEQKPEGQWPIRRDDTTLGDMMRARGYKTAAIGKWGLGPPGSTGDANDHGFDLFYGYNCQRVAHSYYPPHMWRNREREIINERPVPGHHRPGPDAKIDFDAYIGANYAPDLMLKETLQFLRDNKDEKFFLYFAPVEPHVAMQPPQVWVDRYPKEWDDKPYRGDRGYLPHPRPRAAYAAMISDLDEHVGAILKTLDELGLADNTLIIFSSDNGPTHDRKSRYGDGTSGGVGGADLKFFASAGGLRGRKGSVYEGGIRVPMIARWPGRIAPNSTSDHPSAFYDVMPTLAAATGATAPANTDGVSFLPALLGAAGQKVHPHMVWEFHGYGGQQAVIFGEWKAIRRNIRRGNRQLELYHLAEDRDESEDVAAAHPDLVARAAAILVAEHTDNPVFRLPLGK
jgi:arylsulfatase A-like enzyme